MKKTQFKYLLNIAGKILKKSKMIVFALLVIIGLFTTTVYSGVTVAYAVEYNGEVIGEIKNKSDYYEAVNIIDEMMENANFDQYAYATKFKVILANEESLDTPNIVAENLVEKTSAIEKGVRVYVNGRTVAYIKEDFDAKAYIKKYLENYIEDNEVVSSFVSPIECVDGYFLKNDFMPFVEFEKLIKSLDVQSVKTVKTEKTVNFSTVKKRDDSISFGSINVESQGVKGLNYSVSQIIMVNGKPLKTVYVGEEVVKEPIDRVVTVGNKGNYIKASWIEKLDAIWPLQRVKGQNISAYWGDERNHKGIDIASAFGTEIYAVQSGTVIEAEYDDGYGYHIVIEHDGEFKTLYAHASELCVKKGQTVSKGQLIAYVGSTGMSTGNHLHFEVIRNGEKLNPSYFLGL